MQTYIVYTGNSRKDETSSLLHCKNLLQQVTVDSEPKFIIHHYKRSFNGFVAKLTKAEADKMAELDGVVSIFPDKKRSLLTTKSWDFIVIDTGIWPESNSFNDEGFSPPPSKWKGICQTYNFTCNNKIIGARYYGISFNDVGSPRDYVGHGTHVASTAAGNIVSQASMLGLGHGTSRGGVPSARIAVYKVFRSSACDASNILSAFDDAIADRVDMLSVSIGGEIENHHSIFKDPLSIGSFHAMKNGVLTVFAAGNDGPQPTSLDNFSPWSIVVGAGTIERKFGISINIFDLSGNMYPIIYAGDAPNTQAGFNGHKSKFCSLNSLNSLLVKGKIVLCKGHIGSQEAFRAGAIGVLTQGQISRDTAFSFPLPGCYLRTKDAKKIHKYIYSTRTPTATIFKTTESENTLTPVVASFSARGPSIVTPDILKG
ncbi:subtilisin-like serine endopeptidase family protein [Medicago truncatula]|uniref:Subtilisin-like serine endopeptidase family protein n=1 Tax=Medicago truncatula TaxID=3880 RepID=G7K206_MEDTR|nr:subtilisin-like serine endopeptidase family protein [Medicago truncatula]